VALLIRIPSNTLQANTIVRASLADAGFRALKVVGVLPLESSGEEPDLRVIVEAEATPAQARGLHTLELQNEEGKPVLVLKGVRFPDI
jgi:hypothetical protein